MNDEHMTIQEWLNICPFPVLASVYDSKLELNHVGSTYTMYEEGTIVVAKLKTVSELLTFKSGWRDVVSDLPEVDEPDGGFSRLVLVKMGK